MHTFEIDADRKILFAEFNGSLDLRELIIHMNDVVQDEAFQEGMSTLADLRNAFINISIDEISALRDLLQQHERKRKSKKWAVVVKSATTKAMINFALPMIGLKKAEIRTFQRKENALAWLMASNEGLGPDA